MQDKTSYHCAFYLGHGWCQAISNYHLSYLQHDFVLLLLAFSSLKPHQETVTCMFLPTYCLYAVALINSLLVFDITTKAWLDNNSFFSYNSWDKWTAQWNWNILLRQGKINIYTVQIKNLIVILWIVPVILIHEGSISFSLQSFPWSYRGCIWFISKEKNGQCRCQWTEKQFISTENRTIYYPQTWHGIL